MFKEKSEERHERAGWFKP